MTSELASRRRALVYGLGLGALWAVAAALRPGTTYHLAQLLVAGAMPVVLRLDRPDTNARELVAFGALGGALALGITGLLVLLDWLMGPSLLSFGRAVTESVVFSGVGTVAGIIFVLVLPRR